MENFVFFAPLYGATNLRVFGEVAEWSKAHAWKAW